MRLPLEVLASIREAVGEDVPIGIRLRLDEYTPFAYHLDHGLKMAEGRADEIRACIGCNDACRRSRRATADREIVHPWDWGPEFAAGELGAVMREALDAGPGVVLFALEGLDEPRRRVASAVLASR